MILNRAKARELETAQIGAEIEGRSLWADARIRFFRNKAAVGGLIILILVGLFAAFGQHMTPWSNEEVDWGVLGQVDTMGRPSFESKHSASTRVSCSGRASMRRTSASADRLASGRSTSSAVSSAARASSTPCRRANA